MAPNCKHKVRPWETVFGTGKDLIEGFLDSSAQANYDSKSVQAAVRHGFY